MKMNNNRKSNKNNQRVKNTHSKQISHKSDMNRDLNWRYGFNKTRQRIYNKEHL